MYFLRKKSHFSGQEVFLFQQCIQWTQNEVFQVQLKIDALRFSELLHKIKTAKNFKIDWNDILKKNIFFRFLSQNEPKIKFFTFLWKINAFNIFDFLLKCEQQDWKGVWWI